MTANTNVPLRGIADSTKRASAPPRRNYNYTSDGSAGIGRFGNMSCSLGSSGYCPQVTFDNYTNRIAQIGSAKASYDAAGNLTGDDSYSYQYDGEGRLASVMQGSTTISTSTYNALGLMVRRVIPNSWIDLPHDVSGRTTGFYNDGGASWWEQQLWGGGRLLGHYDNGTTYLIHQNDVGSASPTQITDASGAPSGDALYYPWGNLWQYDNEVNGYWQFYGSFSRFQADLGLYLTPNRSYRPFLGRWLSPDPLGGDVTNPQSFNRYAYALNNPVSNTDPLGLASDCTEGSDGRLHCGQGDSITVNGGSGGGTLLPGGCADVYVDGLYEGNTCSAPPFGGGLSYPTYSYPPGTSPGGGGGGGGASATAPKATGQPSSWGRTFTCASDFAEKYSIAGGLHALGIGTSGVGGFVTNALGGNMWSGATNLIQSFGNGSAGGHNVFYNMAERALEGPSQGLPGIRGPWGASVSDVATGAIAGAYYNGVTGAGETLVTLSGEVGLSLATKSAVEFASGVGIAKFAYDSIFYGAGLLGCRAGVIQ